MVAQDLTPILNKDKDVINKLGSKEIFKVLKFDFTTERQQNAKGVPFSSRVKALLRLIVAVDKNDPSMYFYDALSSQTQIPYTIFFCQRGSNGESHCTVSAVFEGYVTNVEERYQNVDDEIGFSIGVDMILRRFHFVEDENTITALQSVNFSNF